MNGMSAKRRDCLYEAMDASWASKEIWPVEDRGFKTLTNAIHEVYGGEA